jgi:hypothetical protein
MSWLYPVGTEKNRAYPAEYSASRGIVDSIQSDSVKGRVVCIVALFSVPLLVLQLQQSTFSYEIVG